MDLLDIIALFVFGTGLVLSVSTVGRYFYYREQLKASTRRSLALHLAEVGEENVIEIEVDAIYESFADVAVGVQDGTGVLLPVHFRICLN
jgi:hypothetical protein